MMPFYEPMNIPKCTPQVASNHTSFKQQCSNWKLLQLDFKYVRNFLQHPKESWGVFYTFTSTFQCLSKSWVILKSLKSLEIATAKFKYLATPPPQKQWSKAGGLKRPAKLTSYTVRNVTNDYQITWIISIVRSWSGASSATRNFCCCNKQENILQHKKYQQQ